MPTFELQPRMITYLWVYIFVSCYMGSSCRVQILALMHSNWSVWIQYIASMICDPMEKKNAKASYFVTLPQSGLHNYKGLNAARWPSPLIKTKRNPDPSRRVFVLLNYWNVTSERFYPFTSMMCGYVSWNSCVCCCYVIKHGMWVFWDAQSFFFFLSQCVT